jgi:uncharacterized protein (DUF433 family)
MGVGSSTTQGDYGLPSRRHGEGKAEVYRERMGMAGSAGMHRSVLGVGAYTVGTASHLLGIDEQSILRWGSTSRRQPRALLVPTHGWAYTFHDLVSLAVIAVLLQREVPERQVRRALDELEELSGEPRPLARRDIVEQLATAGRSILLNDLDLTQARQQVLLETLSAYLKPIEYDDHTLLAQLWRPSKFVLVDPEIQVGRPCIDGTRVTTDVVASRVEQGEDLQVVADDLRLTVEQVLDAVSFEERLDDGIGLAVLDRAA